MSRRIDIVSWLRDAYGGALPSLATTQIDGVPGQDIVIGTDDSPASFVAYTVVAARDRALTIVPAPISSGWFIGAFYEGGGTGFTCRGRYLVVVQTGSPLHRRKQAEPIRETTRTAYQWESTGWVKLRSRNSYGPFTAGGWKCPGLPGFPP